MKVTKASLIMFVCLLIGCFGCSIIKPNPDPEKPDLTIQDHRASFLFDKAGTRVMNILAHNLDDNHFNNVYNKCKANGDKVIYLYVGYNNGDGPGTTSIYVDDKFGNTIDENKVNSMKNRMKKIRDDKLYIVGWLFADDNTKKVNFKDTAALKNYIKAVVDRFDSYISEYVIGIEVDEYLSSAQVNELAAYIKGLTNKSIASHQVPGKYNYSTSGNISKHYHQYGFNKSTSYIESETKKIIAALGKPVIGAEYDMSSDSSGAKARGDAVIRGGGSGTGNGRN